MPGHAASIGVAGLWSSETAEAPNPDSVLLAFDSFNTIAPGTGIFSGFEAVSIAPLPLFRTAILEETAAIVRGSYAIDTAAFDGTSWKIYENTEGQQIVFNLDTDATWTREFDVADTDTSWEQGDNAAGLSEYSGTYILPDGSTIAGTGVLNLSSSGAARTYETTQQTTSVIPLPASAWLLLGASSLLAYLGRRRKSVLSEPAMA